MRTVPRHKALHILTDVLANRLPLDESIEAHCFPGAGGKGSVAISPVDRAWLTEVTSGVLRNLRRLDTAIDAYALKKKPSGKIRKILQIAVYQLLHQDRVFPATVVSETVDFIRSEEGDAPSRFANALLRKIADAREEWLSVPAPTWRSKLADKAAWANLPEWWWAKWEKAYGFSEAMKIAASALTRPEIWFRVKGELPEFLLAGPVAGSAKQKPRDTDAVDEIGALDSGERDIRSLPGFGEGAWIVQDLASQILANRFFSLLQAQGKSSPRILDRCAAPGGKSVTLSWLGAEVIATDYSEARRKILESTVARAAPAVKVILDSEVETSGPYDAVWIDAPCSGSGILRRHPDVRWLKKETEISPLTEIQRKLLKEAFQLVPVGGLVFYTVCSLFPEEGKAHLAELGAITGVEFKVREEIILGPHQDPSTDGFYGVAIERLS